MITDPWQARYHAQFNAIVHTAMATWYARLDLAASVIVALAASASVGSLAMQYVPSTVAAWSVAAAVLSLPMPRW